MEKEKIHAAINEPKEINWFEYLDTEQKIKSHINKMQEIIQEGKNRCKEREIQLKSLQEDIIKLLEDLKE